MIKIQVNGEWVEGEPIIGELKRMYWSETGYVEMIHQLEPEE